MKAFQGFDTNLDMREECIVINPFCFAMNLHWCRAPLPSSCAYLNINLDRSPFSPTTVKTDLEESGHDKLCIPIGTPKKMVVFRRADSLFPTFGSPSISALTPSPFV